MALSRRLRTTATLPPPLSSSSRPLPLLSLLLVGVIGVGVGVVGALPCEDYDFRFYTPDFSAKVTCDHASVPGMCSRSGAKKTIADQLCPKTCGRCVGGSSIPCADAPSPVGIGTTGGGGTGVKTCAWVETVNGRKACSSPALISGGVPKKMVDAVCPVTCGVCAGSSSSSSTAATTTAVKSTVAANNPAAAETAAAATTTITTTTAPPASNNAGDMKTYEPAQIMLHWEGGYNWQDKTYMQSWCWECGENCGRRRLRKKRRRMKARRTLKRRANNKTKSKRRNHTSRQRKLKHDDGGCQVWDWITIAKCDKYNKNQRWVWEGGSIKPDSDTGLCVDAGPVPYQLRPCNIKSSKQNFFTDRGFNTRGVGADNRFELHPRHMQSGYCVTQHHHPTCGEELRHQACWKTRRTKTSYWVAHEPKWCGHSRNC